MPVLVTPPVRRLFNGSQLTDIALHVNSVGVNLPAGFAPSAEPGDGAVETSLPHEFPAQRDLLIDVPVPPDAPASTGRTGRCAG
ncbi:hypothetical protein [Micromonospora sp. KC207]|uniref:hypothetical protein n=1 Tax=Micromonospora sp. KC207 TaxID=2530377 RepID=UPI001A9EA87E|nr:hypothetical protein [Micromonospora sp. KC207]